MATYILDAMRYKEGAFMAAWLTMGAANLAAIFSALLLKSDAPVALTLLTFLLNALTLFLAGGCVGDGLGGRGCSCALPFVCCTATDWCPSHLELHPLPPLPPPPCGAGLWASLQFRFLQLQYPGVVIAVEKMLMAGCLPVAAAVQVRLLAPGIGLAGMRVRVAVAGDARSVADPLPSSLSPPCPGCPALHPRRRGAWWRAWA